MTDIRPVTVTQSFILPEGENGCIGIWTEVARAMRRHPSCRNARVLRSRHKRGHYLVVSEWESASHFNEFVRRSGVLWLVRACPVAGPLMMFEPMDGTVNLRTLESHRGRDVEKERARVPAIENPATVGLGQAFGRMGKRATVTIPASSAGVH